MQKAPYVFPVIGGRKVEHLYANLEALEIALTPGHIASLDGVMPFRKGFPYDMFVGIFPFRTSPLSYAINIVQTGGRYRILHHREVGGTLRQLAPTAGYSTCTRITTKVLLSRLL